MVMGVFKKKGQILAAQILQFILMGLANLVIGGYASVVSNLLSIVRNVYAFKYPFTTVPKIIFVVVLGFLSLRVNTLGVIGYIPFITTASFTLFMDKDAKILKYVIIFTMILWTIYDASVKNYATAIFDSLTVITNIYGIIRIKKEEINS